MRGTIFHTRKNSSMMSRLMENQTARFPSNTFLWLATGSILGSLTLRIMDRRDDALFVGEWAPTLLVLGLYSKLLRMLGKD